MPKQMIEAYGSPEFNSQEGKISEVIGFLQSIVNEHPDAKLSEVGFDMWERCVYVHFSFNRLETDEELTQREALERSNQEYEDKHRTEVETKERATLRLLFEKYGYIPEADDE